MYKIDNTRYQELNRITLPSGIRHYVDPLGFKVPSVTTILSNTGDRSGLEAWIEFVGKKKAEQIRDEAAAMGTLMHTHMEAYIKGEERPIGNNHIRNVARGMADAIITNGLPHLDEVWGIEVALYYPEIYAGTSDLIGVYKGKPAIMDFKNTLKPKTRDKISGYAMQLAAYAEAHNKVHGTDINTGVILMADRDCNYYEFVFEGAEFDDYTNQWWGRVEEYYNSLITAAS